MTGAKFTTFLKGHPRHDGANRAARPEAAGQLPLGEASL